MLLQISEWYSCQRNFETLWNRKVAIAAILPCFGTRLTRIITILSAVVTMSQFSGGSAFVLILIDSMILVFFFFRPTLAFVDCVLNPVDREV